jgi:hypothetical protein
MGTNILQPLQKDLASVTSCLVTTTRRDISAFASSAVIVIVQIYNSPHILAVAATLIIACLLLHVDAAY